MKQVIQATLSQSKEINAMQFEIGNTYSMLKDLHNHIMPNIRPLPPHPNYAEIRANNAPISLQIPSNRTPRSKQHKTREEEDLELQHLMVTELNEPSSTSDPRASANIATPEGPDMY
jgi:hypothetical protein